MKQKLKATVKGHIFAYDNLTGDVLYDGPNNLTAAAEELLTKLIGTGNYLSTIAALKASVDLKNANVVEVTYPDTSSVKLRAIFTESDFDDTLDELQLRYNGADVFSQKTGLSIAKNGTTQIAVEWTLNVTLS